MGGLDTLVFASAIGENVPTVCARDCGDTISLEVHDDGPGVPADQIDAIFDPCFTTKPDGTGVGLLAIKAFAVSCRGEVAVGCSDLGGAVFSIRIPRRG